MGDGSRATDQQLAISNSFGSTETSVWSAVGPFGTRARGCQNPADDSVTVTGASVGFSQYRRDTGERRGERPRRALDGVALLVISA